MFKTTDDKIGVREYLAIILMTFFSKITDSTPTLFIKEGMTAGWLTPLISGLITFIILLIILYLIKKYDGKGLIDIIYILLGRYLGFIFSMILLLPFIVFTFSNSRSYATTLTTLFFPNTNILVIYFSLVGTSAFVACTGLKGIGRSARIFVPYIIFGLICIFFLAWKDVKTEYLLPLQGSGIKEILKSGFMLNSALSEIITYTIFRPMIRNYKEFKFSSILGLWISIVSMMAFFALYIMIFDYSPVTIINYPFHTLTRFIRLGRFFSNFEAIFLLSWLIIAVIRYAIYLYTLSGVFAYSIKTVKVEPLVPAFAILTLMLGMLPENNIIAVQVIRLINIRFTSILYVIFPLILLLASMIRGAKST